MGLSGGRSPYCISGGGRVETQSTPPAGQQTVLVDAGHPNDLAKRAHQVSPTSKGRLVVEVALPIRVACYSDAPRLPVKE